MAQESTSFIIDGSHSLIDSGQYSSIINYLEFIFLEKCKKMRKTDYTSVFISNTEGSKNEEEIDDIIEICSCEAPMNGKLFKNIIHEIMANNSKDALKYIDEGSIMLVKTLFLSNIQMSQAFKKRKIKKQIMIFSDNLNGLDIEEEYLELINEKLENTRLILVNCSPETLSAESEWNIIIERQNCNGLNPILITMDELTKKINQFATPLVKPIRVFSGELRLGSDIEIITYLEPRLDEAAFRDKLSICVTVEGFPATKSVSGLGRKMMIKETVVDEDTKKEEYLTVKSVIEYEIHKSKVKEEGEEEDSVKQEEEKNHVKTEYDDQKKYNNVVVGTNNITKAYRYGFDYVVVPPTLLPEMQFASSPGIDIRGFISRTSLPRQYLTSESVMILPDLKLGKRRDAKVFSTLVDVLMKHDLVAIARYVSKFDGEVNMVCLCPMSSSNENIVDIFSEFTLPREDPGRTYSTHVNMLILNILPFAEDVKHMTFPSLLNPPNTNGKSKSEVKEDTTVEDELMKNFIASMDGDDLSSVNNDLIYRHYSECNKTGTVIPLPDPHEKIFESDPLMKPHITLQYKNQAISSWILQKYLPEEPTAPFTPPMFSKELRKEIGPFHNTQHTLSQDDKDRIKQTWTTKEGQFFTSISNGKAAGDMRSWLATEEGPSQFEFL